MNPEPEPRSAREGDLVADTSGGLERAVQQDLQRIRAESRLARNDAANELMRALDAALAEPLALSEIAGSLDRLEGQALPSFAELEGLLAAPETSGLSMERDLLSELIERIRACPQRVHLLLHFLAQVIRQEDDVAMPALIELRFCKRPVISDFG